LLHSFWDPFAVRQGCNFCISQIASSKGNPNSTLGKEKAADTKPLRYLGYNKLGWYLDAFFPFRS
jgi:hypothetical protein